MKDPFEQVSPEKQHGLVNKCFTMTCDTSDFFQNMFFQHCNLHVASSLDAMASADETPEEELLDLLTCHRPVLWLLFSNFPSKTKMVLTCLVQGFWHVSSQASLGPYAWQQHPSVVEKLENLKPSKLGQNIPCHDDSCRSRSPVSRLPCLLTGKRERYLENEELSSLDRTVEVFSNIEKEPHMSHDLPKAGATAGRILAHASTVFEKLHKNWCPMSFKFGITHDAVFRWYHRPYGYKYSVERFDRMVIIYAASDPVGPAFLEASLIDKYGSSPAAHS